MGKILVQCWPLQLLRASKLVLVAFLTLKKTMMTPGTKWKIRDNLKIPFATLSAFGCKLDVPLPHKEPDSLSTDTSFTFSRHFVHLLSVFLGWQTSNLITRLSRWWALNESLWQHFVWFTKMNMMRRIFKRSPLTTCDTLLTLSQSKYSRKSESTEMTCIGNSTDKPTRAC